MKKWFIVIVYFMVLVFEASHGSPLTLFSFVMLIHYLGKLLIE